MKDPRPLTCAPGDNPKTVMQQCRDAGAARGDGEKEEFYISLCGDPPGWHSAKVLPMVLETVKHG